MPFWGDSVSRKVKIAITVACALLIFTTLVGCLLWQMGCFVTDRSVAVGLESLEWQGRRYNPVYGKYDAGRVIAKTTDGLDVHEIDGDPDHNFLLVASFVDSNLYVCDDYEIPTNGKVTRAYWNYKDITDKDFLQAIGTLLAERHVQGTYKTKEDGLFVENNVQNLEVLYVAYENCPVASLNKGYIGKLNGEWIITVTIESELTQCTYYRIPEKHHSILEKYF